LSLVMSQDQTWLGAIASSRSVSMTLRHQGKLI
jgi:hypothetical protein